MQFLLASLADPREQDLSRISFTDLGFHSRNTLRKRCDLGASGTMCPILPRRTDIYYKWRPRSVCESCGFVHPIRQNSYAFVQERGCLKGPLSVRLPYL